MNNDKIKHRSSFIINTIYFSVIFILAYLVFKYVASWLMPFIVGFVIAYMLKPFVNFASRKIPVNKKILAGIIIFLAYLIFGSLLFLIISKLGNAIIKLVKDLPYMYEQSIVPAINEINLLITRTAEKLSPELVANLSIFTKDIINTLKSFVVNISSTVIGGAGNFTKSLPSFFIALVFSIMSSIFISMDYGRISAFIIKQFPPKYQSYIFDFKTYLFQTVLKYLKAVLILMIVTFFELCICLSVIKVENAIAFAAFIAIADALPVLGTGGIMIPWVIIETVKGNYSLAVGLLVSYVIITIVRNIIEPKIIGEQLGLHPLVTIIAMYVGFKAIGLFGMIIMPILAIILINFHNSGKVSLWKE